jgi:hypothetical protein
MTIFARLAIAVEQCPKAMCMRALVDVPIVVSLQSLQPIMKTDEDASYVRLESTNELGTIVLEGNVSQEDVALIVSIIVGDKEIELIEGEMH